MRTISRKAVNHSKCKNNKNIFLRISTIVYSASLLLIANTAYSADDHQAKRINQQCIQRYLCDTSGKYCRWNTFCDTASHIASVPIELHPVVSRVTQKAKQLLHKLTPDNTSLLQQRLEREEQYANNPLGIILYQPNYILPYYNTGSPYQSVYAGQTPDDQRVMRSEFKTQLSLMMPVWRHLLGPKTALNIGYTQLFYWQFYAKSQYFRETNYEPEIFFSNNFTRNWLYNVGLVHQSNGRGGALERSWNRVYIDVKFSGQHWLVSIKPWLLIFNNESSNLHNPDIAHYLGYERTVIAYQLLNTTLSVTARNIESGFRRGSFEADWTFPVSEHINGFVQFFSGYGQSLIEYNHHTNSAGVGIALNSWI